MTRYLIPGFFMFCFGCLLGAALNSPLDEEHGYTMSQIAAANELAGSCGQDDWLCELDRRKP